ncbi:MAG: hypothetical protein ACI93R_002587 [Flavobacteriales bacterium]|jgi:hypothetical protein
MNISTFKLAGFFICATVLGCSGGNEASNETSISSISGQQQIIADADNGDCSNLDNGPLIQPYPVLDTRTYEGVWDFAGRSKTFESISSTIMGLDYRYHIYLPPEYDLEANVKFPVVYRLDGQWGFDFYSRTLDVEQRPVILVAIQDEGRRGTDYLWPGISNYYRFFTEEFIPHIESQYRASPDNRTLTGTSAGGVASLFIMLLDEGPDVIFTNHFALDPAVFIGAAQIENMIDNRVDDGMAWNKNLVITSTSEGGFSGTVIPFTDCLAARNIDGLDISEAAYSVIHTDADGASLSVALDIIYGPPQN